MWIRCYLLLVANRRNAFQHSLGMIKQDVRLWIFIFHMPAEANLDWISCDLSWNGDLDGPSPYMDHFLFSFVYCWYSFKVGCKLLYTLLIIHRLTRMLSIEAIDHITFKAKVESHNTSTMISRIPSEVLLHICDYLGMDSIAHLAATSRCFRQVISEYDMFSSSRIDSKNIKVNDDTLIHGVLSYCSFQFFICRSFQFGYHTCGRVPYCDKVQSCTVYSYCRIVCEWDWAGSWIDDVLQKTSTYEEIDHWAWITDKTTWRWFCQDS